MLIGPINGGNRRSSRSRPARDFSSFADVQAHAQQIGNDTTITVDPNRSVTLQNVALNTLSAGDFRFA
jgi:hypothetical protein